jgi:hypothetical protein
MDVVTAFYQDEWAFVPVGDKSAPGWSGDTLALENLDMGLALLLFLLVKVDFPVFCEVPPSV